MEIINKINKHITLNPDILIADLEKFLKKEVPTLITVGVETKLGKLHVILYEVTIDEYYIIQAEGNNRTIRITNKPKDTLILWTKNLK